MVDFPAPGMRMMLRGCRTASPRAPCAPLQRHPQHESSQTPVNARQNRAIDGKKPRKNCKIAVDQETLRDSDFHQSSARRPCATLRAASSSKCPHVPTTTTQTCKLIFHPSGGWARLLHLQNSGLRLDCRHDARCRFPRSRRQRRTAGASLSRQLER